MLFKSAMINMTMTFQTLFGVCCWWFVSLIYVQERMVQSRAHPHFLGVLILFHEKHDYLIHPKIQTQIVSS